MNDREGKYVFLWDIENDDYDEIKQGLEGEWSFLEGDLFDEYNQITQRIVEGEDTDQDNNRLYNEIRKIVEDDISSIVGYKVTITEDNKFYNWDNYEENGKWYKVNG
jgi:hypothetical protein